MSKTGKLTTAAVAIVVVAVVSITGVKAAMSEPEGTSADSVHVQATIEQVRALGHQNAATFQSVAAEDDGTVVVYRTAPSDLDSAYQQIGQKNNVTIELVTVELSAQQIENARKELDSLAKENGFKIEAVFPAQTGLDVVVEDTALDTAKTVLKDHPHVNRIQPLTYWEPA